MKTTRPSSIQRKVLCIAILGGIGLLLGGAPALAQPGTWPFLMEEDRFERDCPLDLRFLNEKEAGQIGWMVVRDGKLYIPGKDRPFRAWGGGIQNPSPERIDYAYAARKWAKMGVNQMRIMTSGINASGGPKTPAAKITDIDMAKLDDAHKYVEQGGSLKDLRKRIADLGLTVESAIGFATWGVDDDAQRTAGIEQMKRDMELIAEIGGIRIAAPPSGLHKNPADDLRQVAERYGTVLELGVESGVAPQLEIWGSAKTLSRLSEAIFVAVETAHPDACLLLDVAHLHKGGSGFATLRLLNGAAMHCFHINDYPTQPPPEVKGGDRVMPGDGVAPLTTMLRDLHAAGFRGALSLELFSRIYYEMDALKAAQIGIEKTRQEVTRALRQVQGGDE